jgi:hypothetical protein
MDHRFDAQDAFAFAVDLQGQPAAVQLEDGQIIATFRRKKHAVEKVAPGSGRTRLSDKRVGW